MRRPATALLTAGAVVAGLIEVYLAHRSTGPGGILERRYGLLGVIGLWWAAYAVAVLCVLRLPRRLAIGLLLVLAIAVRLAAIAPKAPLSDDLYRYAWDGVVQTAGIDPYRYPPAATELTRLHDPWLWPPGYTGHSGTQINRPTVRTIYPPVAEAWFTLEHLVVPLSARDRGYEGVGLLLDLAILAVLMALLRDRRWAAVYALAPLPVLESVQNAHVDALAVLLTLGAIALAERRRSTAAVAVLALATLTKVYPALLLPLLLRERSRRVRNAALFAAICVTSYVPHALAVGRDIVGYLPGYLKEEKYGAGTRYLLVGILGLRGPAASIVVALALLLLAFWSLRTTLPLRDAAVRVMLVVLLLITPVQPWYAILLLALITLARAWWALPIAAAIYPLFFTTVLHDNGVLVGRISYGGAAALLALVALLRRTGSGSAAPTPRTVDALGPPSRARRGAR